MRKKKATQSLAYALTIILLLSLNIAMFFIDYRIGIVTSMLSIMAVLLLLKSKLDISKEIRSEVDSTINSIKSSAGYSNLTTPIAMLLAKEDEDLLWYNDKMAPLIEKGDFHRKKKISKLLPGLDFDKLISSETMSTNANIYGRHFEINAVKHERTARDSSTYYSLYFFDLSEYKSYESKYKEEKAVVLILEVDNYDDLMSDTKEAARPAVQAEIDSIISLWATRSNAMIKKYDRAKYLVIMNNFYFENLVSKRFEILDRIREIEVETNYSPTLSIGCSLGDLSYYEMERESFLALEMALARGGDQAVIKQGADYEFYGGKSKAVEKRNRVKARIIAHGLTPIIDESDKVYIMGHQYPDMDAFGAAIGVHKAARDRGKISKIVLKEPNETIKAVYDTFDDVADEYFISPEEVLSVFDRKNDLLIVVDTHRTMFTECPDLVKIAERKVIFDHHRRHVDQIENAMLSYIEPYSSSTAELVTEVLQYMEKNPKLTKREADALLAGIMLDTKNFTVKTGVRTFETCAALKRFGADTSDVQQFMQDDIKSFVTRSNIVKNARRYSDDIAISVFNETIENPRLIGAQAADEMLTIRGINASFVVVREDNKIYISARSHKDFNVQVIMERLGGGGHLSSAGAQYVDIDIAEAERRLLESIDLFIEEECD